MCRKKGIQKKIIVIKFGFETWLAHGTLLGWFWGKKIMPWDNDLDVQMRCGDLDKLFKQQGQTSNIEGGFYLDINPHYSVSRPLKENKIDARLIDQATGKFIDITCLFATSWPGTLSCKQPHTFREADIFPLRTTEFEDSPAKVPASFYKILGKEYTQRALFNKNFKGYKFTELSTSDRYKEKEGSWVL